jgi:hypothetical protein
MTKDTFRAEVIQITRGHLADWLFRFFVAGLVSGAALGVLGVFLGMALR